MTDATVKDICQAWAQAGYGDECFWEHWAECPTEETLTPNMLLACIETQAAEIERLNTQCEGLFQAAMNNGQALIIAESKLAKALKELEWQASQPEAHPFMAQHASATLAELTGGKGE